MFKKLFSISSKTITSAAIIIAAASLISRLLGVLRDRVLAGEFGAGETLDIYYAAFRIPDLIFNLLVLGAISAGFIPIFSDYVKRDQLSGFIPGAKFKAWELVSNLLNILIVGLIIICGLFIFFTPALLKYLTPGFNPEMRLQTVAMTRIMMLSPIILGVSAILGGVLQSYKRFFIYSIAPIMYNVGIIFGALFFVGLFGIYGLAWGVVFGAALHLLIKLGGVFELGWRPKFVFKLFDPGIIKLAKMMAPRTLSLAVSQLNLFVITVIASTLSAGSITIFNLANNLQYFPLGIFGVSFAIAAFPTLSELTDKKEEFVANLSQTLRQIMFYIVPASALLIILRAQIVRVILGSGKFDWSATIATMDMLAFFSISLFAQALIPLLARAFYARQNTAIPFIAGLISAVINVILSLILAKYLGVAGLALAFSLSSLLNLCILWIILHLQFESLDELNILWSVIKISVATFCLAGVVQALKYFTESFFGTKTFIGIFAQGFISGGVGLLIYFAVGLLLGSPELLMLLTSLRRRFFKSYKPQEVIDPAAE